MCILCISFIYKRCIYIVQTVNTVLEHTAARNYFIALITDIVQNNTNIEY